jgi:hypothetical protein
MKFNSNLAFNTARKTQSPIKKYTWVCWKGFEFQDVNSIRRNCAVFCAAIPDQDAFCSE